MLSAGERPQPPLTSAVVDRHSPASKVALNNLTSSMGPETNNPDKLQHIWVITGPAGCGKSTVGKGLRDALGLPFLEGDDFHPYANKEKMGNGTPLTDADRWDWLISLRKAAIDALSPNEANVFQPPNGVVVACSALKQKYRDVMRVAAYGSSSVQIHFVYLKLDEEVLMHRVQQRSSHYMKSSMVLSQLEALEEPQSEWDALTISVEGTQEQVHQKVFQLVEAKLAEYL